MFITKKQYFNICKTCDYILLRRGKNAFQIANSFLHVIREHPNFLKNYKRVFEKINYFFIFYSFVLNTLKFIKNILISYFLGNRNNFNFYNKDLNCFDVLIISHLLNKSQLKSNKDFYFGELPNKLRSLTFLINHSKEKLDRKNFSKPFNNKIIDSNFLGIFNEIRIFFSMVSEKIFLINQVNSKNTQLQNNILKLAAISSISPNSLFAIRLGKQVEQLVEKFMPKFILITYEGFAWERIVFSSARKINPKILCIGYQHAAIFKYQHAIKRDLGAMFNPDYIFTPGKVSKYLLEKVRLVPNKNIVTIGSLRNLELVKRNHKKNICLVAPEGFIEECEIIFKFSFECASLNPNINFIWRMHPLISFDFIKKKLPKFNFLPKNILISKNSLAEDLVSAKALLYRGSTVAITAGANGVIPIYIKQKNEMSIDPIFNAERGKFEISDANEFKKVFFSKADNNFIIRYCKDYYEPINYKKIENFFNSKIKNH